MNVLQLSVWGRACMLSKPLKNYSKICHNLTPLINATPGLEESRWNWKSTAVPRRKDKGIIWSMLNMASLRRHFFLQPDLTFDSYFLPSQNYWVVDQRAFCVIFELLFRASWNKSLGGGGGKNGKAQMYSYQTFDLTLWLCWIWSLEQPSLVTASLLKHWCWSMSGCVATPLAGLIFENPWGES